MRRAVDRVPTAPMTADCASHMSCGTRALGKRKRLPTAGGEPPTQAGGGCHEDLFELARCVLHTRKECLRLERSRRAAHDSLLQSRGELDVATAAGDEALSRRLHAKMLRRVAEYEDVCSRAQLCGQLLQGYRWRCMQLL